MLSTVVFQIGPAIFDIAAASVYIALKLQPWIAVIVFVTLRCERGGNCWAVQAAAFRAGPCVLQWPQADAAALRWVEGEGVGRAGAAGASMQSPASPHFLSSPGTGTLVLLIKRLARGEALLPLAATSGMIIHTSACRSFTAFNPAPPPSSGYIPMTIYLTEWRGKYRR
jgi:hypothetical protein